MYPRNAASPERIAVGTVVLIADGAVQTSGVSITVTPQGGSSTAGSGTISYEQGVVFYTPTQAETNYTSFIVTAYKALCLPVSITVVTTASVTPGRTRLESVTHTGATVPTVSDVTNLHASSATLANQTTLLGRLIGTIAAGTHSPQSGDSYSRIGALGAGLTALAQSSAYTATRAGYIDELAAANLPANIDTLLSRLIGTIATGTHYPATAAQIAVLSDLIDGGRIDLLIDGIKSVTDAQAATGTGLSSIPWNAAWDAEVQSEVNDALVALHLDHLLAVDYDPAAKPGAATALLNELIEDDAGVSRYTVNALENAPSGTGASAAVIADAVWDELKADHSVPDSYGAYLDTEVSGITGGSGLTAQETRDALKLAPSAGAPAAESIDEKLDNVETSTAGLGGAAMRGTDGANTTAPDNAGIAGIQSDLDNTTDGLGALKALIDIVKSETALIVADTNELQTNQGSWLTATGFATPTNITAGTITTVSGNVDGSVGSVVAEVSADMVKISGSATAADNLEASALSIGVGTVNTANIASTTTTFQSADITEQTPDHMNGRIVIFYDSADPLWRQATSISDYAWDAGNSESMFTVVALTEAPGNADKFVIV